MPSRFHVRLSSKNGLECYPSSCQSLFCSPTSVLKIASTTIEFFNFDIYCWSFIKKNFLELVLRGFPRTLTVASLIKAKILSSWDIWGINPLKTKSDIEHLVVLNGGVCQRVQFTLFLRTVLETSWTGRTVNQCCRKLHFVPLKKTCTVDGFCHIYASVPLSFLGIAHWVEFLISSTCSLLQKADFYILVTSGDSCRETIKNFQYEDMKSGMENTIFHPLSRKMAHDFFQMQTKRDFYFTQLSVWNRSCRSLICKITFVNSHSLGLQNKPIT